MLKTYPEGLEKTIQTRWPDYLDIEYVTHSDYVHSFALLDQDYRWYVFRTSLSLDGRWSIIPICGFEEPVYGTLQWGVTT